MDSRNRSLNGSISAEKKVLSGDIRPKEKKLEGEVLSGDIRSEEKKLGGTIPGALEFHYSDTAPEYAGPYEVVPDLDAQTLETAGHLMREDVTIKPIPIYEVSNNAGGTTVIIGG